MYCYVTLQDEFQDLNGVDVDGDDFKALPPEIQHEILSELKDKQKKNSWAKLDELPEEANDFAKYQLLKILKQSKLSQKLDDIRKEMNSRCSGGIVSNLSTGEGAEQAIASQKVMSEDASHLILIKNTRPKNSPKKPSQEAVDLTESLDITSGNKSKKGASVNEDPDIWIEDETPITVPKEHVAKENVKAPFSVDLTQKLEKKISSTVDLLITVNSMEGGFIRDESDSEDVESQKTVISNKIEGNSTCDNKLAVTANVPVIRCEDIVGKTLVNSERVEAEVSGAKEICDTKSSDKKIESDNLENILRDTVQESSERKSSTVSTMLHKEVNVKNEDTAETTDQNVQDVISVNKDSEESDGKSFSADHRIHFEFNPIRNVTNLSCQTKKLIVIILCQFKLAIICCHFLGCDAY